jgi:hypothetical protein
MRKITVKIEPVRDAVTPDEIALPVLETVLGIDRDIEIEVALAGRRSVVVATGSEGQAGNEKKRQIEKVFH